MTQHLVSVFDLGIDCCFFSFSYNEHLIFTAKPANNREKFTGMFQIGVQK